MAFAICAAVGLPSLSTAGPVTAPYTENFNNAPLAGTPDNFIETNPSAVTVSTSTDNSVLHNQDYRFNIRTNASASSSLEITNLGAGHSFSFSSSFSIFSDSSTSSTTILASGFGFLSTTADLSAGSGYQLLFTPFGGPSAVSGRLTLREIGPSAGGLTAISGTQRSNAVDSSAALGPVGVLRNPLTITATYSGSTINLTGSLTVGATTLLVSAADTTPPEGTFFGFYTATAATSSTASIDARFDNLTIAPEPSAGLLLIVTCLGIALVRRSRIRIPQPNDPGNA